MRAAACILLFLLFLPVCVFAQWREPPKTGSQLELLPDRTNVAGMSGLGPEITLSLVRPERNAPQHRAVVKVSTWGTPLADPAKTQGNPDANYLIYKIDNHSQVLSGSDEMVFDNLAPGQHTVTVMMADSKGRPEGDKSELKFEIP
jgi:hypothetical protein